MRCVVKKVALAQVFCPVLQFPAVSIIPPVPHIHSSPMLCNFSRLQCHKIKHFSLTVHLEHCVVLCSCNLYFLVLNFL